MMKRPTVTIDVVINWPTICDAVSSTANYPGAGAMTDRAIDYVILGLIGEAGELANKRKKDIRGDAGAGERLAAMRDELGDVFWYWVRACEELGTTPAEVVARNLAKLADRKARGVIAGDGDER